MRTSERFCSDSHEICTVLWERKIITCLRAGSACANPRAAPTRLVRARLDRRSARPSSGRLEPKHSRAQTREPPGLRDAAEAGEEAARRRARVLRAVPPPPRPGPAPPLRQQADQPCCLSFPSIETSQQLLIAQFNVASNQCDDICGVAPQWHD